MSEKQRNVPLIKTIVGEEDLEAVKKVLFSGMLAEGSVCKTFEAEFAKFTGAKYVVTTTNGTTSLFTSLEALGIGPGDEVITVGFTFIASANVILQVGAIPVFVDIDPKTWCIDPQAVEKAITKKTKAILPVHIFGNPSDMKALKEIADKHNLVILEDACQAHGAKFNGIHVGLLGNCGAFSMYATKNLQSGEGGIITTNDEELANRCRSIKNHGRQAGHAGGYDHYRVGYNFRMTDYALALALEQLKKLPKFLETRARNAKLYHELLADVPSVSFQQTPKGGQHCNYIVALKLNDKKKKVNDVVEYLKSKGVSSRPIYSVPVHLQPVYKNIKEWKWAKFVKYPDYTTVNLPVTNEVAINHFEVPENPGITEEDVKYVCNVLKGYLK